MTNDKTASEKAVMHWLVECVESVTLVMSGVVLCDIGSGV